MHDVQRAELGASHGERGRNDREVLRDIVGDRERCQRAPRHQHLLSGLNDLDELGKQMLMTRGALTTFSIANDVANVVSAPRVISICFPVSTISMSLVGFEL